MLTTTTRTREQLCPSCGELVDAATGFRDGAQPADGSFVVCIACAAVMRYGADFRLVMASIDDVDHPEDKAHLQLIVDAISTLRRRNATWPPRSRREVIT
jgi:hypothetical protein